MQFVIVILVGIICGAIASLTTYAMLTNPSQAAIERLTEWLYYAVAEAEKALGGGTGQLKLRYVYDKALEKFPQIVRYISFEQFSSLVDVALARFKEAIKHNEALKKYVNNENI